MEIEGTAVTKIEDTRLIMAFERMRRVAGQTNIGGTFHLDLFAVACDIGEPPFQPDVEFVARMAMVRDSIIGGHPQQNFTAAFGEITAERCDFGPGGKPSSCSGFHSSLLISAIVWSGPNETKPFGAAGSAAKAGMPADVSPTPTPSCRDVLTRDADR